MAYPLSTQTFSTQELNFLLQEKDINTTLWWNWALDSLYQQLQWRTSQLVLGKSWILMQSVWVAYMHIFHSKRSWDLVLQPEDRDFWDIPVVGTVPSIYEKMYWNEHACTALTRAMSKRIGISRFLEVDKVGENKRIMFPPEYVWLPAVYRIHIFRILIPLSQFNPSWYTETVGDTSSHFTWTAV